MRGEAERKTLVRDGPQRHTQVSQTQVGRWVMDRWAVGWMTDRQTGREGGTQTGRQTNTLDNIDNQPTCLQQLDFPGQV